MASRHLSRIAALQALFAGDVRDTLEGDAVRSLLLLHRSSVAVGDEDEAFTEKLLHGITAKRAEIDGVIERVAPQWPLKKIALIDRNILRVGLYELLYGSVISVPPKVALNESIELAKTFGGDSSSKFVNGVLGSVYRDMGSPRKEEAPRVGVENETYAAGLLVYAKEKETWFVALVQDSSHHFTFPKTSLLKGELSEGAAKRVAVSELGITVENVVPFGEYRYMTKTTDGTHIRCEHAVSVFVACALKKALTPGKDSIREARWISLDDIDHTALYEDQREVIESGIAVAEMNCV